MNREHVCIMFICAVYVWRSQDDLQESDHFPLFGYQGSNSGHQVKSQVPLSSDPIFQPSIQGGPFKTLLSVSNCNVTPSFPSSLTLDIWVLRDPQEGAPFFKYIQLQGLLEVSVLLVWVLVTGTMGYTGGSS